MTNPHAQAIQEIVRAFKEGAKLEIAPTDIVMSEHNHGDFAVACFKFARNSGRAAEAVAEATAIAINEWLEHNADSLLQKLTIVGPYINIALKQKFFSEIVTRAVKNTPATYGNGNLGQGQRVVLEYVSPNTNKPLHLGHLRNAALGWSIAKLLETSAQTVIKAQIINDRGIHIMKPILAYQRWGSDETPESTDIKSDHFVAKYYVMYGEKAKYDTTLDEAAQELLLKWEAGDEHVRKLWGELRSWALRGLEDTYQRIGISFDRNDFESDIYEDGKAIVLEALVNKHVRQLEDCAIVVDLDEDNYKVLIRANSTTLYITQDLALARRRMEEVSPDRLLYVIGREQDYQFEILFAILEKLGIATPDQLKHVS